MAAGEYAPFTLWTYQHLCWLTIDQPDRGKDFTARWKEPYALLRSIAQMTVAVYLVGN